MAAQYLYSDNDTDTFADTLKAVGVAEVSRAWLRRLGRDVAGITLEDKGDYFSIALPAQLDEAAIAQIDGPFPAGRGQPLLSRKQIEKATKAGRASDDGFLYDDEQQKRTAYFNGLAALAPADRALFNKNPQADQFGDLAMLKPSDDLGLYVYINHFKVADGYNGLLAQWLGETPEAFRANLWAFVETFAVSPNASPRGAEQRDRVTLLQLINPVSGKGGNAPKANSLSIGNLDGDWLPEYLKFVGLFTVTAPFTVRGSKDRKTYVLHPTKIPLNELRKVMATFRASLYSNTPIKLDILASLRFTRTLVGLMREALVAAATTGATDPFVALFGAAPAVKDVARGFDVTFYKDMGAAFATMNLATINLPEWLRPIATTTEADATLALLEEHERVIASVKLVKRIGGLTKEEEGSEELELLRRYRDFLSGRDGMRFFDFAARYGGYALAKRHRQPSLFMGQFTTTGMETLMAQTSATKPLTPVVHNEGFREIATAIRQATVLAQYHAARQSGYPYEVRYGLGQDLLRAAAYPTDFLAALSAFIQSYNAENARIDERITKGSLHSSRRSSVRTDHISAVVELVDQYGSEVICKMLVAYGYARDPRSPDAANTPNQPNAADTPDLQGQGEDD
ncbi:MAG TPA: hypothetical protein VMV29_13685 [Ktedonobacterales bacterium]|nr:hypothetical protein [Ktedonobacterales bacterium]